MNLKLDAYDRKLLTELYRDSRQSIAKIAHRLRLPKETANYRIKRLIEEGYIKYFYSRINASRLGHHYYKVFLQLRQLTPQIEQEIIDYILQQKSCVNLRVITESVAMTFVTMQQSPSDLRRFISEFMQRFGLHVLQKRLHIIASRHRFALRFLHDGIGKRETTSHDKSVSVELNDLDRNILAAIATNARIRLVTLAQRVGEEPRLVQYHLRKLEREAIIIGYCAALNYTHLRREFVNIHMSLRDQRQIPRILQQVENSGMCLFAHELIGFYDLSLEFYIENDMQLSLIIEQLRDRFAEHIIICDVYHVNKEYTMNGSPFDRFHVADHTERKRNAKHK